MTQKAGDQTVDGKQDHAKEFIWRLWKAIELSSRVDGTTHKCQKPSSHFMDSKEYPAAFLFQPKWFP